MNRLSENCPIPKDIKVPGYARRQTGIGIVHLGLGAFHRAHQALYTEEVLEGFGGNWAVSGVSLRSPNIRDRMRPQDGLYTLLERDGSGDRMRIIGGLREVLYARENPDAVLERMASQQTRIVSMTVTEKGYCHNPASGKLNLNHPEIVHDFEHPRQPQSALGFLVRSLEMRLSAGLPPFTALSCDNLPQNGKILRNLVLEFSNRRDPSLAHWIDAEGAFPCCMLDRIVPATEEVDRETVAMRLGVRDEAVVVTEPFRQWVIEDRFACGRPAWEEAGAELVEDVRPFEEMKLRLLNGTHSTLAYLGYLAGFEYVADAVGQPEFERLLSNMMAEEIAPTLMLSGNVDLVSYQPALLERYRNPALRHRLWQIAMDGSQKLPQRLFDTILDNVAAGRDFPRLALAVAAWMRYVTGIDEQGKAIDVRDPLAERFSIIARESGWSGETSPSEAACVKFVHSLLEVEEVFDRELSLNTVFSGSVEQAFQYLTLHGANAAVGHYAGG